jgi:LytS/YehU family sensor histidine kinase
MLIFCVLAEQVTYAVAIGQKSRREQNKVTLLEKYWINELETNKHLQNKLHHSMLKYQEQLELEVQVRTTEMLKRSNELQEEKVQKKLEEYKRAALESELKSLRTQINPHFLFNCMNILSSFVFRDRKEEALDFIQKFSQLMRLVLENSMHHAVKVEKDIEALRLYVELEAIRYDHCFQYKFEIDPELIQDDYFIPPLLLQPYVENAIRHGLVNKENDDKLVKVTLRLNNDHIICEIFDNGVGREKAYAIKKMQRTPSHNPMGMKVTESRIQLLQELSGNASVQIIDLAGEEGGTMIRITLPVD